MKTGQLSLAKLRPDTIREAVAPLADETPIARFRLHGMDVLSDAEVVSLVADLDISDARMMVADGLRGLSQRDWRFTGSSARQKKQETRVAAALELGRRVSAQAWSDPEPVRTPDALARALIARYSHRTQEHFVCVFLNAKNVIIAERVVFVGTINSASVSTREPIRMALDLNAVGIIVSHNHPSGSPEPSAEDLLFTRRMNEACKLMQIELLDHLILGTNRFVSLQARGAL